ncbi:MAG: hypothetical protein K6357_05610 [Elusimicrobiota bacterium]
MDFYKNFFFFLFLLLPHKCLSGDFTNSGYDNIFETRDYITILRISNVYSNYKLILEKAIESNKIESIKYKDIINMEDFALKTIEKLNYIYSSYKNAEIRSQIYQIKFEIEDAIKIIKEIKKINKKKNEFKKNIFKLESLFYRIEVYLKGLSQNLSVL